jgi:putative Ca2+/H+ antiporter (TMEM165/GDT1 family)
MARTTDRQDPDWRDRRCAFLAGPAGVPRRRVHTAPREFPVFEPLYVSAGVVAIAEIGDKTQLLAIVLAAKFRKPVPIILGILAATLLNHAAAATLGFLIAKWLTGQVFQVIVGAAFIAMAGWALIPDKEDEGALSRSGGGVFLTTLVAFFFVEIGDKTQIATSLLAARYHEIALVTAGTTLGMMLANVPAVLMGEAATRVVPLNLVRIVAAVIFALIGAWVLLAAFHVV